MILTLESIAFYSELLHDITTVAQTFTSASNSFVSAVHSAMTRNLFSLSAYIYAYQIEIK